MHSWRSPPEERLLRLDGGREDTNAKYWLVLLSDLCLGEKTRDVGPERPKEREKSASVSIAGGTAKHKQRVLPGGGSAATASAVRFGVGESTADAEEAALSELLVRCVRRLLLPPLSGFFAVAAMLGDAATGVSAIQKTISPVY